MDGWLWQVFDGFWKQFLRSGPSWQMQGWQGQREIAEGVLEPLVIPRHQGQLFVQIRLAGSIQGDPSKLRKIPNQTEKAENSPRPGAVRCSDCIKNDEKTVAAGQAQATQAKAATGKAKARKNKVKKVAQKTRATSEGPLLFLWWSAVVHELFNVFSCFFCMVLPRHNFCLQYSCHPCGTSQGPVIVRRYLVTGWVRKLKQCHKISRLWAVTGWFMVRFMVPGALGYRAMPIGMTTTEKDTVLASVLLQFACGVWDSSWKDIERDWLIMLLSLYIIHINIMFFFFSGEVSYYWLHPIFVKRCFSRVVF